MNRIWKPLAGVLIAAGLLSACGGDDGPSKEEYIRQADAICADLDRKLDAIPEPKTPDEAQPALDQGRAALEEAFNKLKGLKRPKGNDPKLDEYFRKGDEALAFIRGVTAANLAEKATEGERLTDEASRAAREYGFKECGKDD